MLAETGMAADETLFIDDSAANCAGAERAGLHSLHVDLGRRQGAARACTADVTPCFAWQP